MKYQSEQQIEIPRPCPKYDGKLIATRWDAPLNILKLRSWIHCLSCKFQQSSDDFKKDLLTV